MKLRRKRVVFAAVAVLVIVLVIIVLALLPPEDPREASARRLIAVLRGPSGFRGWLIKLGVLQQPPERRGPVLTASLLADMGQPAVPACIRALRDDDWRIRYCAVEALRQMDPVPTQATPALIQAMKDENSDVRSSAAGALGGIGRAAAPAVPALIDALSDKESAVRGLAARALGGIGQEAKPGVRALMRGVKDKEWFARREAVQALGKMGPVAKEAGPVLEGALKDEDEAVRCAAAWALAKLGLPNKGLPVLIAGLEGESAWLRGWVARRLGEVGPPAKAAIPALTKALKDQSKDVRKAAAEALKKIQAAPTTHKATSEAWGQPLKYKIRGGI